jgi:hypothetical protein
MIQRYSSSLAGQADGALGRSAAFGSVDRDALASATKLYADQKITFAQPVGYPKK